MRLLVHKQQGEGVSYIAAERDLQLLRRRGTARVQKLGGKLGIWGKVLQHTTILDHSTLA